MVGGHCSFRLKIIGATCCSFQLHQLNDIPVYTIDELVYGLVVA